MLFYLVCAVLITVLRGQEMYDLSNSKVTNSSANANTPAERILDGINESDNPQKNCATFEPDDDQGWDAYLVIDLGRELEIGSVHMLPAFKNANELEDLVIEIGDEIKRNLPMTFMPETGFYELRFDEAATGRFLKIDRLNLEFLTLCEIQVFGAHACQLKNGGCQHVCNEEGDKAVCTCAEGYTLETDRKTCTTPWIQYDIEGSPVRASARSRDTEGRLVDGSYRRKPKKHCAVTRSKGNKIWFEIDMGMEQEVSAVSLLQQDGRGSNSELLGASRDISIFVLNEDKERELCGKHKGILSPKGSGLTMFKCKERPLVGRYILIERDEVDRKQGKVMFVCEAEVYGGLKPTTTPQSSNAECGTGVCGCRRKCKARS